MTNHQKWAVTWPIFNFDSLITSLERVKLDNSNLVYRLAVVRIAYGWQTNHKWGVSG